MEKITISIIIPVYNNESYLDELVYSLSHQSYMESFEILFLDDGSTDHSLETLQQLIANHLTPQPNISVQLIHDGENKKQGYRRNQGIKQAKGDWILFVDSDDYIHTDTLKICMERAQQNPTTDMVLFNFGFVQDHQLRGAYFKNLYQHPNPSRLVAEECEELLAMDPYFSVNRLYRKSFLTENNIYFGEGYFYEDFIFYVRAALKAQQVELLPNLFYFVRVHNQSTTKTNYDHTHTRDVYRAIDESCAELVQARGKYSKYNAIKYFLNRALLYAEIRSNYSESQKIEYIQQLVQMMQQHLPVDEMTFPPHYFSNLYYALFKIQYYQRQDAHGIFALYKLYRYKPAILKKIVREHKRNKKSYQTRLYRKLMLTEYQHFKPKEQPVQAEEVEVIPLKPVILMLGFDYRYAGNSKYLFQQLSQYYDSDHLKFVCKEDIEKFEVEADYFIEPHTEEFAEYLQQAKVVIAESWIPLRFQFSEEQTLIQLWHGQPMKKLLFDSYELSVLEWNPRTKQQKSQDTSRWDYLLSESDYSDQKFKTSLVLEQNKLLPGIYPRNQWLMEHRHDESLKQELRNKLHLPDNKKVVLYLPTWRDYNFKKKSFLKDYNYLINFNRFLPYLDHSEDYVFVMKEHEMDHQAIDNQNNLHFIDPNEDVQPYYLIADLLITDYSSSLFDALLLDIPSYLIFKDFDYYNLVRGIYDDFIADFHDVIAYSEKELAEKMNQSAYPAIDKKKYLPRNQINWIQFLEEKMK